MRKPRMKRPLCSRARRIRRHLERITAQESTLKARSRTDLRGKNLRMVEVLKKSTALCGEYGLDALILMGGRGIRLGDLAGLLARKKKEGGDIIDYVIEGEREALKRRYFAS